MAVYLQVNSLTKSYGDRMLFEDVTFGVNEGDKIGIIARNGSGKSTLLNIIAGAESPDCGEVIFRNGLKVGFLEQQPKFNDDDTVIESCLRKGSHATDAIVAYERALSAGDTKKLNEAIHLMDTANAWDYEDRVKQMLGQLGVDDFNAKVTNLSGGQQKRVAIARLLLQEPEFIMLDEPTNHLDITVIEWLESYLSRSRATLLLVTHDRYFLERICNKIIEIDHRQSYTYEGGGYDNYLRRREERIEALTGQLAKIRNTLRKETEWMRRQPQARAGKAKYRIDNYYELKRRSQVDYSEKNINLSGAKSTYIGSKIFEAENVCKRYGDKVILDDFNYIFARRERLGIIGANGVGKSTFIKMLQGLVAPDSGEFIIGETVKFGYYSQEGIPTLDTSKKVIDAVTDITEEVSLNKGTVKLSPMQFLTRFLFTPADQQKYIHTLSGGERARLHLATVLMLQPNFLILDEPTNDLDIITLGLLEEYLAEFEGCLIVVSHDRHFLDSIVDHMFVFEGDGIIKDFPGGYSDYRRYLSEQQAAKAEEETKKSQNKASATNQRIHADRSNRLTFKEKKELEALTEEISVLENEIKQLDELFSSGKELDNIVELTSRYTEIKERLDEAEMRWLELSEKND